MGLRPPLLATNREGDRFHKVQDNCLQKTGHASAPSYHHFHGLLAYLDHAVGWEIGRRAGQSYALQRPMAAIPDDEVAASLDALTILAIFFRRDPQHDGEPTAALLDRVASILRVEVERPDMLH